MMNNIPATRLLETQEDQAAAAAAAAQSPPNSPTINIARVHLQATDQQHTLPSLAGRVSLVEAGDRTTLEEGLNRWIAQEFKGREAKGQEVKEKILNAYDNNETSLNLAFLGLKTLPPEIGLLRNLERLYLENNQIQSLPPEIGLLIKLERLYLSGNQIQSLPPQIGLLIKLERLYLTRNPNLNSLPLSLGNIPGIIYLDIESTNIPRGPADAILASCRALRDKVSLSQLPDKLKLWISYAKMTTSLTSLETILEVLNDRQKSQLYEWLVRLEKTRDFRLQQEGLAKTTCEMLQTVFSDETFREDFFVQVSVNLERCEDRGAMAYNEIYTAWRLSTLPEGASLKEKLQIMESVAKTNVLRKTLQNLIQVKEKERNKPEEESVEIFLYYEKQLKDSLKLCSVIEFMSYAHIGKRDWIDEKVLNDRVLADSLDELISLEPFKNLAKKDSNFQKAWGPQDEVFAEQQEALDDQASTMKEAEYLKQTEALAKERKTAWNAAAKTWAKGILKG